MIVFWRGAIVTWVLVLLPIAVALPQDAPAASGLLAMLAKVPQEAGLVSSNWATVRFVDYAALFEVEGVAPLRMLGNVDLLRTSVPLAIILSRIAEAPEALSYVFAIQPGQMASSVGFESLLHVDRSLEFGDPPNLGLLLDGNFAPETIGLALQGRRFSSSTEPVAQTQLAQQSD